MKMAHNIFKTIIAFLLLFCPIIGHTQNFISIRVIVPDQQDEVFITGSHSVLGNWKERIAMKKITDLEREIELSISGPIEFNFYRDRDENIDSEAIIKRIDDNPHQQITNNIDSMYTYKIKGWRDNITYDEVNFRYNIERLNSTYFPDAERIIKISLPENYSKDQKYPVIYVLDGDFLFETTADYVRQLTKGAAEGYENIPPSIVVGLFHNDRYYETAPNLDGCEYREGALRLKKFIENELIPRIDEKYSTSGFNCIVGHSDTGHFVMNLLNQERHNFGGLIAMSVSMKQNDVWGKLVDKLSHRTKEKVFIGYGRRDDDFNEFAECLSHNCDVINPNLMVESFNAGHLELPSIAIIAGLQFMFREYKNFDDFVTRAADEDFSMENYASGYLKTIASLYGIHTALSEEDYFHLVVSCAKNKNVTAFYKVANYIEANRLLTLNNHTYFWLTRDLGDMEKAKEYAYKFVESKDTEHRVLLANIQAYIDFFVIDMSSPSDAIAFLEKAIERAPEYKLEYAWFIAKIGFNNKVELHKAKNYFEYCKRHFKENRYFDKEDLLHPF